MIREDLNEVLDRKANELRSQLSMLGDAAANKMGQRGPLRGRKVPPKYRSPLGETWGHVLSSNAPCPSLLLRFVNRFAVFENGA